MLIAYLMEKFILINKDRSRIKVFEPFEGVSKTSSTIDAIKQVIDLRWE